MGLHMAGGISSLMVGVTLVVASLVSWSGAGHISGGISSHICGGIYSLIV